MTSDPKPAHPPEPEPLPPAEHEKAVAQAERQRQNLQGEQAVEEDKLPHTHSSAAD